MPQRVMRFLDGAEVAVVSDFGEEPSLGDVERNLTQVREFGPDWFLGLGGGSSMDMAKILFALYERPDISAYDITPPLVPWASGRGPGWRSYRPRAARARSVPGQRCSPMRGTGRTSCFAGDHGRLCHP
ncbi:iron-containing alcohol dehydrogenase [Thermogymnomonas acidicola]|uniref:iron-containing alcohol dehydrogenase n=1 Tax=Thermogymnomonas acidicola TaxID=399579 RepID=UPI001396A51F|nr:iron-containing alcohol dehydrogenase [Thermogymnomonas acidicola]